MATLSYSEPVTWKPAESVTNHAHEPLESEKDFFVPPPLEIGTVTNASTTMREGARPMTTGNRFLITGLVAGGGMVLGYLALSYFKISNGWLQFACLGIGPLVLGLIAWFQTGFTHTCCYVGTEGIASFQCKKSRENITRSEVFLFQNASTLRTSLETVYRKYHAPNGGIGGLIASSLMKGTYEGTDYKFAWSNGGGRPVFEISGRYHSEKDHPPSDHPYYFGKAAEYAWSVFQLEGVLRDLRNLGTIGFTLGTRESVRVSLDGIEFRSGGQSEVYPVDDLDSIRVKKGDVEVKRKGARVGWFKSTGVRTFKRHDMVNAELFLLVVEKVFGLKTE
jgi:hypothetical protein